MKRADLETFEGVVESAFGAHVSTELLQEARTLWTVCSAEKKLRNLVTMCQVRACVDIYTSVFL